MAMFGLRSFSSGFLFSFAGFILLCILVAAARLFYTRRRLRRATIPTEVPIHEATTAPIDLSGLDDEHLFGVRALEGGFYGGVVQSNAIPHQSSTMRERHIMRTSVSFRASDDVSIVSTGRRQGFILSRSLPGNDERRRSFTGDRAFRHTKNLRSSRRAVSGGRKLASPGAAIGPNKPYPPLPRGTEPSKVSLLGTFGSMKTGQAKTLGRKRSKSLPSPSLANTPQPSPQEDTARPNAFMRLNSTPSLTHLDGSVESVSPPQTPCNRNRCPPKVRARAKSTVAMPTLPHHPMTDFSKFTQDNDDLQDSYFDAHFRGYVIPLQSLPTSDSKAIHTKPRAWSYIKNESARRSIPIAMSSAAFAQHYGQRRSIR